eukprot:scaffold74592_cov65-Phaeocystis_antarctica.AAC.3
MACAWHGHGVRMACAWRVRGMCVASPRHAHMGRHTACTCTAPRLVAYRAAALKEEAVPCARRPEGRLPAPAVQLLARRAQPGLRRAEVVLVGAHADLVGVGVGVRVRVGVRVGVRLYWWELTRTSSGSRTMWMKAAAWNLEPKKKRCSLGTVTCSSTQMPSSRRCREAHLGAPLPVGLLEGDPDLGPDALQQPLEEQRARLVVRAAEDEAHRAGGARQAPRLGRAPRRAGAGRQQVRLPRRAAQRRAQLAVVRDGAAQAVGGRLGRARLHGHRLCRLRVRSGLEAQVAPQSHRGARGRVELCAEQAEECACAGRGAAHTHARVRGRAGTRARGHAGTRGMGRGAPGLRSRGAVAAAMAVRRRRRRRRAAARVMPPARRPCTAARRRQLCPCRAA